MIRPATEEDMPRVLEMSMHFYPLTSYWTRSKIPMDCEYVSALIMGLIDNGILNVAVVDDRVVGMVVLVYIPFLFNPNYSTAGEIIWWVEPEYSGAGLGRALLQSVESSAREKGVRHIQMIDLATSPIQAGKLYESEGYELTEKVWTKVI